MTRIASQMTLNVDQFAIAGLTAFGAGIAWYAVLMRRIAVAAAYGPICGHASLAALHCASCYAALSMAFAGLGLLATAEARRRRAAFQSLL
jgi:hypothetical protein